MILLGILYRADPKIVQFLSGTHLDVNLYDQYV